MMGISDIVGIILVCIGTVYAVVRYIVSGTYARRRHIRVMLSNPDLPDDARVELLVAALLDSPFAIQ